MTFGSTVLGEYMAQLSTTKVPSATEARIVNGIEFG